MTASDLNASNCPISFLIHDMQALTNLTDAANFAKELEDNLVASVSLAAAVLLGSFFLLFFGRMLVRPTLFLAAVGVAAIASFFSINSILAQAPEVSPQAECVVLGVAPAAIGLVAGCFALCMLNL